MRKVPRLGEDVDARLLEPAGAGDWKVTWEDLPPGWSATLKSRTARLYGPGDEARLWVFQRDPQRKTVQVSDSDFGRMPISDRMRPRYLQALEAATQVIRGARAGSVSAESISEMKGMLNRCVRMDQPDWKSVYDALGRPSLSMARKAAEDFGYLARALRQNKSGQVQPGADWVIADMAKALRQYPGLADAISNALASIKDSAPRLDRGASLDHGSGLKADPLRAVDTSSSDPYIVSQVARAKVERANTQHERALRVLVEFLEAHRYTVERSRLVDAFCHLKTGPAIFEVKSITRANERTQCRHALSQLYEYRYIHKISNASLWIVLSDQPRQGWIADYLLRDRGLELIWIKDGAIGGPSQSRLLESGSERRRREGQLSADMGPRVSHTPTARSE
ncbi:MAG: hypothetical protein CL878_10600 [Dehalococcoidia bacterium]|nr:hypothetical protein [Dehalococcoidia bacterium]